MNPAYLIQVRRSLQIFREARATVPVTSAEWTRTGWSKRLRGACDIILTRDGITEELRLLVPPEKHADLRGSVAYLSKNAVGSYSDTAAGPAMQHLDKVIAILEESLPEDKTTNSGARVVPDQETLKRLWLLMHPKVVRVARSRFEAGHYADSVGAALKEFNAYIKRRVRHRLTREYDGASLMQRVFSPKQPLIRLGDLDSESGWNTQQGYMQMFAGAMTGIRNPEAHANISIGPNEAVHLLFMISQFFWKAGAKGK